MQFCPLSFRAANVGRTCLSGNYGSAGSTPTECIQYDGAWQTDRAESLRLAFRRAFDMNIRTCCSYFFVLLLTCCAGTLASALAQTELHTPSSTQKPVVKSVLPVQAQEEKLRLLGEAIISHDSMGVLRLSWTHERAGYFAAGCSNDVTGTTHGMRRG